MLPIYSALHSQNYEKCLWELVFIIASQGVFDIKIQEGQIENFKYRGSQN